MAQAGALVGLAGGITPGGGASSQSKSGGVVGYGAMGTPTVVALVLAGLAAIATAVP